MINHWKKTLDLRYVWKLAVFWSNSCEQLCWQPYWPLRASEDWNFFQLGGLTTLGPWGPVRSRMPCPCCCFAFYLLFSLPQLQFQLIFWVISGHFSSLGPGSSLGEKGKKLPRFCLFSPLRSLVPSYHFICLKCRLSKFYRQCVSRASGKDGLFFAPAKSRKERGLCQQGQVTWETPMGRQIT